MIPWFPQSLLWSVNYANTGKYCRGVFEKSFDKAGMKKNETVQKAFKIKNLLNVLEIDFANSESYSMFGKK